MANCNRASQVRVPLPPCSRGDGAVRPQHLCSRMYIRSHKMPLRAVEMKKEREEGEGEGEGESDSKGDGK
jgi:hypothetical protein